MGRGSRCSTSQLPTRSAPSRPRNCCASSHRWWKSGSRSLVTHRLTRSRRPGGCSVMSRLIPGETRARPCHMAEPEVLLAAQADTGESPVWDSDRGGLWWVDIPRGEVHLLDPSTGRDQRWAVGQPIGTVALARGGDLLLAMRDGLTVAKDDLAYTAVQWTLPGGPVGNPPNDRPVDSRTPVRIGTMARGT